MTKIKYKDEIIEVDGTHGEITVWLGENNIFHDFYFDNVDVIPMIMVLEMEDFLAIKLRWT